MLYSEDCTAITQSITEQISERAENIDFRVHRGQVQDRYVWADRKNLNRILLNVLPDAQAPDVQA